MLIEFGANVSQKDMGGRTPLYIATKENNLQAVKTLLSAKASPIIMTNSERNCFDVAADAMIEKYLIKAQLLQICLKIIPQEKRAIVWKNEGLYYFRDGGDIEEAF